MTTLIAIVPVPAIVPIPKRELHSSVTSSSEDVLQKVSRAIECSQQLGAIKVESHACGQFDHHALKSLRALLTRTPIDTPSLLMRSAGISAEGVLSPMRMPADAPSSLLDEMPDAHIAVVTVCYADYAAASENFPAARTPGFAAFCEASRLNKQRFCAQHGCQVFFVTKPEKGLEGREAAYNKWLVMKSALQEPGILHVLLMDADALFMNFMSPISSLLPRGGKQVTMSGDSNAILNDGVLLFNKGNVTTRLTKELWDLYPPPRPWGGQSALIYIFTGKQALKRTGPYVANRLLLATTFHLLRSGKGCVTRGKKGI